MKKNIKLIALLTITFFTFLLGMLLMSIKHQYSFDYKGEHKEWFNGFQLLSGVNNRYGSRPMQPDNWTVLFVKYSVTDLLTNSGGIEQKHSLLYKDVAGATKAGAVFLVIFTPILAFWTLSEITLLIIRNQYAIMDAIKSRDITESEQH